MYTPGPWKAVQSNHGFPDIIADSGNSIAMIVGHPDRSTEENYANASLVSAAPDLFSALKKAGESICDSEIEEMLKDRVINYGPCETGETETGLALIILTYLQSKLLDTITSAIAKAEGKNAT
jgi:hypothetical protein